MREAVPYFFLFASSTWFRYKVGYVIVVWYPFYCSISKWSKDLQIIGVFYRISLEESAQSASCDGKLYVCQLLDHSLNIKQQLVFLLIPIGSY